MDNKADIAELKAASSKIRAGWSNVALRFGQITDVKAQAAPAAGGEFGRQPAKTVQMAALI